MRMLQSLQAWVDLKFTSRTRATLRPPVPPQLPMPAEWRTPHAHAPGTHCDYSTGNVHLLKDCHRARIGASDSTAGAAMGREGVTYKQSGTRGTYSAPVAARQTDCMVVV